MDGHRHDRHGHGDAAPPAGSGARRDPVCGMNVDPARAAAALQHDGTTYYFCHPSCRDKFKADPQRYLGAPAAAPMPMGFVPRSQVALPTLAASRGSDASAKEARPESAPRGSAPAGSAAVYVCPMDPEVRERRAGAVPDVRHGARAGGAGAAAARVDVPDAPRDRPRRARRLPDLRHGARTARRRGRRRGEPGADRHDPPAPRGARAHGARVRPGDGGSHSGRPLAALVPPHASAWLQLALATPVVLWAGWPFFARAWTSLRDAQPQHVHADRARHRRRRTSTAWRRRWPRRRSRHRSAITTAAVPVYFEAAAVITTLVLLGQVLELRARSATGGAIRALLGLAPPTARGSCAPTAARRTCRSSASRSATACACAPARRCRSTASSSRARAPSTSRCSPASRSRSRRRPGASVIGGTVNGTGTLVMRAERVGAETLLARIVAMVAEAQRSRAPIQRLADRSPAWFVPAVVAVAVVDLRRVGDSRPRAAPRPRARQRGRGADHRLPVRARARDADVDHGRHRPRRARRRARPQRRGARAPGEGRHAGRRQDRHAHRGQAAASPRSRRRAAGREDEVLRARRRPRARRASIRSPARSSPRRATAASRRRVRRVSAPTPVTA